MSTPRPTVTTATRELTTMAHIRARYEQQGPHATVVMRLPVPGTAGDDLTARWNANETELRRLGASERAIDQLRGMHSAMRRYGRWLMMTANEADAAWCWLHDDVEPSIHVGDLPALVPALHNVGLGPTSAIGAAIDRTGADLYHVGPFDIEVIRTVEGEDEHIHKAASGGWSQPRHQRHSEVVWQRNATLIAAAIEEETERGTFGAIVMTGDDREVRLVEARLADRYAERLATPAAGGRHEPDTPTRLRDAASDVHAERHRQQVARALDDLREELGQQDQAVAGSVAVLEAIQDKRVKALFVDVLTVGQTPHVDAMVRSALAQGADVVTGHDLDVPDGIAAMLRVPYSRPASTKRSDERT